MRGVLSPLRYPGGKRRLASYIAETLVLNNLQPGLFVEPFAGGASVSLRLLLGGFVKSIGLGESDPLLASFWKIVFDDPQWLVNQIMAIPITVETWDRFRSMTPRSHRERALACLFLNRTSFSGILAPGAGPIGGRSQTSAYKIDCRFPVEEICRRVLSISRAAEQVRFVNEGDWKETMEESLRTIQKGEDLCFYLDPPFYSQGRRLYSHYFEPEEHILLRDYLISMNTPWILSYDANDAILELYSSNGYRPKQVQVLYSASRSGGPAAEEVVVTNLGCLPHRTRLWRTKAERAR